jgi:translation initiation factor 3 subunit F
LVSVYPVAVALFSILDHFLRRKNEQARVIGTLLGTTSDSGEVEVRSSFAVPHSENEQQVAIDGDHHRTMYELHHRINPKEIVVGWCVKFF